MALSCCIVKTSVHTINNIGWLVGTRWGCVVSVTPRPCFNLGERTPSTHCAGGWVGPRTGLDTEARGKILSPLLGSNLDRPVVQSVARHCTD
jgi:hypothetical protein